MAQTDAFSGGFAAPSVDSAVAFRSIMQVMAKPGVIAPLSGATPPKGMSIAAGVAILTLCDTDTPVFLAPSLNTPEIGAWIAFHTGAPLADSGDCQFALGQWSELLPLDQYPIGTSQYPDRSATLIVELSKLSAEKYRLTGPGIKDSHKLCLPEEAAFKRNHTKFPLGLDFFFTADNHIAALPRSTQVQAIEEGEKALCM